MARLVVHNPTTSWPGFKGRHIVFDLDTRPCPGIQASGIYAVRHEHYWIEMDDIDAPLAHDPNKPPYRVPLVAEVKAIPWNGLTMASTFSGAGGTCLGFKMAGWRVAWANDSDAHAQATYRLNHPGTALDARDIREVTAADILAAAGCGPGELDLFEGSPPCTVFSTAGKRAKKWGGVEEHAGARNVKVEDLFFTWLDLLDALRPRAFAAENVSGLVKGVAKGYFKDIMRRMKALGYRAEARLLDAQWLGVPQQRQRVIFLGVRDDLGIGPAWPDPLPYRYSVREALPWLSADYRHRAGGFRDETRSSDEPAPAVVTYQAGQRLEARVVNDDGYETNRGEDMTDRPARTVRMGRPGALHVEQIVGNDAFEPKFGTIDVPHPTIMAGGARTSGEVRETTPDAVTRRKFTIAELKRICAFPDDFAMEGSYAEQWARMGNSVPPLMARSYAATMRDALLALRADGS